MFQGREICREGWCKIHALSNTCYYDLKDRVLEGRLDPVHGNKEMDKKSPGR